MTIKRHLPTAARIVLGLIFFVFGLNGFLQFLPMPPGPLEPFIGALVTTGYMLPLIKGAEVVAGALLLAGRFVPLALTLLAPVVVNIVAYHIILAPGGYPMLAVIVALELYLAWAYRESFRPMLQAGARPAAGDAAEKEAPPQGVPSRA